MVVFYTLASLVVLVLTVIAGYYLWLLYQQKQKLKLAEQETRAELARKRKYINDSIQILARGTLQSQLTLTEASIRISTLLDSLPVAPEVQKEYIAFYQLAEKTAHIPIMEDWKALSKKEKFNFDRQREEFEFQHADAIMAAAERSIGKQF